MEGNSFDFNELWAKKTTQQPDVEQILGQVRKLKNKQLRNILFMNLGLLVTSLFIVWVWVKFQPEMLSTKVGIVLIILAMAIFMVASNKSIFLLKKISQTGNSHEYLQKLIAFKKQQNFMQTTMLNVYFVLLSLGLGLYMYEYAARMTWVGASLAYGITAAWILLNWFYFRPKQIRRQQAQTNQLIEQLEGITGQFGE
ncbi:hypothetical protein SAMN05421780_104170 [Flexibacter flexilis DSM 6793]|uniref:Uncharacterized protein n=1 Tax=Flexibacter flexilis DSM 6793 TaxID=927664 RepID=A0A1I1I215_9BACT|nr:hypothetical protein [Flexibacter flexilis]SFC30065.1 hypothetical protein SAMN05421780_104170 [Flexibacter flexilis DSM 6793]